MKLVLAITTALNANNNTRTLRKKKVGRIRRGERNLGDVGHGGKKSRTFFILRNNSLFDCAVRGLCGKCRYKIMRKKMAFAETEIGRAHV